MQCIYNFVDLFLFPLVCVFQMTLLGDSVDWYLFWFNTRVENPHWAPGLNRNLVHTIFIFTIDHMQCMERLFVEPHGTYVTKSVATYVQNQFEIIALNLIFFTGKP